MTKDEQDLFDANHIMVAGSLAHHWTEQACKDWMQAQKELPWRVHIGINTREVFSLQITGPENGKMCSFASFSIYGGSDKEKNGFVSPRFPHVKLSTLETLTREHRKHYHGI